MNMFRLIKTILMNIPIALTMAVVTQVTNIILGHMSKLDIGEMALSFAVSYVFACIIGLLLPMEQWSMRFAEVCGAEKGTRKYGLLTGLAVNTLFCVVMTAFMTWFSLCVRRHAPISAVPGGFLEMIIPVWICCYVVSLLIQRPVIHLAERMSKMSRTQ